MIQTSASTPSKDSELIKHKENQPDVSPPPESVSSEDLEGIKLEEKQPDVSIMTPNTNNIKSTQKVIQDDQIVTQNDNNHLEQLKGDHQPSNHHSQIETNDIAVSNIDKVSGNEQNLQTRNQNDEQNASVDSDSQAISVDQAVQENDGDAMTNHVTDTSRTDHDDLVDTNNDSISDETKIDDAKVSISISTESVKDDNNQSSNQLETLSPDTKITDDHQNVDIAVEQSSAILVAEVSQNNLANEQINLTEIPEHVSTNIQTKDEMETSKHASTDNQTNVAEPSEDPPDYVKATVTSTSDNDIKSDREFNKPEHPFDHSDAEGHLEQSRIVVDSGNIKADDSGDSIASHQNNIESLHRANDEKAESTVNTVVSKEITDEIIIDDVDTSLIQV